MKVPVPILVRLTRRNWTVNCSRPHSSYNQRIPYEPEYLDNKGPQVPTLDLINVQLKSFNFPKLENFSSYVHKTAENMGLSVEECWAAPGKSYKIHTLKPASAVIETEYQLSKYERVVQLADVPATKIPLFLEVIQTALPEGVELNVRPHNEEDESDRYIPDLELLQLKEELTDLGGPSTASKKKK
nr:EOG090X0MUO [Sida crystallina]